MPHRVRLARASGPAHRVRVARSSRAPARRWRARSRRAQVSAIATILGLLLVVTFIANYLATTLPTQMAVNDANHENLVENQAGRLATLLAQSANRGTVGVPLSQPITLGSVGLPPFAQPDGASIGPGAAGSSLIVNFTVAGPARYLPPGNWVAGGSPFGGCVVSPPGSPNPTTVTCSGGTTLTRNFTNGSHLISVTGGAVLNLNFASNYSTIVVATTGGSVNHLTFVGNHDVLFVNTTGGTTAFITIVGNYDTLNIPTTGGSVIHIYLVGNYDPIFQGSTGGTVVTVSAWGAHDAFNSTTTGGANIAVQYTGFNATNPVSGICPYGNLSNTDTVAENHSGGGTFNVTFNNTGYGANGSGGGWAEQWQKVNGLNCPFFTTVTVPLRNSGAVGASFVVHLRNTYAPVGEVAFDQGAVIFAQSGGTPIVVDGPALSFHSGKLSLFVPEFQGQIGSEVGTSTASLSLRLVSAIPLILPENGYSLKSGSTVLLTVVSPYAAAWMSYFSAQPGLSGLATCTGPASACAGPFNFGGPLGKVTLSIPATALSLVVGTYTLSIT